MFKNLLKSIVGDTSGATAVEYGLIVSLIVIAIITAVQAVAGETIEMWEMIETEASEAMGN